MGMTAGVRFLALGPRRLLPRLSAVAAEAASSRALLDIRAGPRLEVLLLLQTLVTRRAGFRQPRALLAALVRLLQEQGGRERQQREHGQVGRDRGATVGR